MGLKQLQATFLWLDWIPFHEEREVKKLDLTEVTPITVVKNNNNGETGTCKDWRSSTANQSVCRARLNAGTPIAGKAPIQIQRRNATTVHTWYSTYNNATNQGLVIASRASFKIQHQHGKRVNKRNSGSLTSKSFNSPHPPINHPNRQSVNLKYVTYSATANRSCTTTGMNTSLKI